MKLSIIIPSKDNLITKCKKDRNIDDIEIENTLWETAIYEVCDADDVYIELFYNIRKLKQEINVATYEMDFSNATAGALEFKKKKIVEGIQILSKNKYEGLQGLSEDLSKLLISAQIYVDMSKI